MEKRDAFYWLKSDRSTFQIFCSRSLRQYRINYKFHVSVRLLTIKISQWAHEDSAVIVKKEFVNPTRTLRVYSNANTSTMVGNQVSDVLREVNFDSTKEGQQYFEPKHRQYLQVRQQEYEVMEIALDDLNGVPVKLGSGVTSVVLHFRHRNGDDDV